MAEEKSKEKWRLVDEALGFTEVIKALSDSKKTIIGKVQIGRSTF